MIEVPVVAEGVDVAAARDLGPVCDFVVPDPSFWLEDDPAAALRKIAGALA